MIRRAGGFGCDARRSGMGGFFTTALNVAGAFVGDPALGSQIASGAQPGYAPLTQTPDQIARTVAPAAKSALTNPGAIDVNAISPGAQRIAAEILPQTAAALAAAGYAFPPGTVGASLQRPSVLNAFGGGSARWVLIGGVALAGLLLAKEL